VSGDGVNVGFTVRFSVGVNVGVGVIVSVKISVGVSVRVGGGKRLVLVLGFGGSAEVRIGFVLVLEF
jgi:hypothetical protein